MKIDKETLLKNGWKLKVQFQGTPQEFNQYDKEINGFHYTLTNLGDVEDFGGGNWYDWNCHIDNPTFQSVGNFEVDTFEQIDIISQIYKG